MNQEEINLRAKAVEEKAYTVMSASGIPQVWRDAGCRVNLIGSLRMGLIVNHLDIDLHVYSSGITEQSSFAIAAKIAALPGVTELTCINGLHTEERCIAWHIKYLADEGELWKFDVIHIESGSKYDGYFERMADRIVEVMTAGKRDTILRLKYQTSDSEVIHGVEYYEAVIADGVTTLEQLRLWVNEHRDKEPYYWMP
ncbi:MAG: phosphoglycerate mutase family protein [Muribaculaceae bacterium]|nr:phosphoglycerate mutase family protein [Muribaculaceae bacterium]